MLRARLSRQSTAGHHYRPSYAMACFMALALALLLQTTTSRAADTWQSALPSAVTIGNGEATWLGIRLYRATLWSAQRPFDASQAYALQLQYHLRVSKQRLVRTSLDEMTRIAGGSIAPDTLARWQSELDQAFIDVAAGDELIGVYLPLRGMQLYNRERLLMEIDDLELAKAFFGIWLDPTTRDAALRRRLLGEAP